MNFTIDSSSTWKNPRNRTIAAVSGIALALSVAIGGISALPDSGSRQASVTPVAQNEPSTLFQTSADAVFAVESGVAVTPRFANTVDAAEASVALALAQPVSSTEARDNALGLGQPGERSAVAPQFANMADAVSAQEQILVALAEGGYTVVASFPAQDALGLGQPGERSVVAPQFANMADAVSAQEQILVALAEGGYTVVVPQFANMVDAWEASVR